MFKKKFAIILVVLTLISIPASFAVSSTPRFISTQAAENYKVAPQKVRELVSSDDELLTIASYAYMDLDSAPSSIKETIISAREKIIFNDLSWTVGGGYFKNPDGTIEILPEFSDLFPGWDIPNWKDCSKDYTVSKISSQERLNDLDILTVTNHYIPRYNVAVTTPTIADNIRSNSVETFAVIPTRLSMTACNISIGQGSSVIQWKNNVPVGGECHIFPTVGARYNVRVSTNYSAGTGSFNILH